MTYKIIMTYKVSAGARNPSLKHNHFSLKRLSLFASPRLDPGVHVFLCRGRRMKTWMAGSSPAKATEEVIPFEKILR
jgi:hypothetical protein